jgi:citrate lyase subunit beta/citryl-CoA lyase
VEDDSSHLLAPLVSAIGFKSDIRDSVKPISRLQTARSFLFAPGDEERKLERALASGADAVVADLEDAVSPEAKPAARDLATRLLAGAGPAALRLVRVNAVGTEWHEADLAAVAGADVDGLVLPKATPAAAAAVAQAVALPIVAIVETPGGLREAHGTASQTAVEVLLLGAVDLGLALGLEPREDAQEILFARSSLVVDSAAAGIRAPVDRVWLDVRDPEGLAADCAFARSLGFRGKAVIHPDQVAVVHESFAPSDAELSRAREIVAAFELGAADGRGVVALDGEMIDLPVVERARQVLSDEKRSVLNAD